MMKAIAKTRRGPATVVALAALACGSLTAPAAQAANVGAPIRAVFLKEFSKTSYSMNRGQLLFFENDDPFLVHGLGGSLIASNADPGKTRLVRNSPYLPPGTYPFCDPLHLEMVSMLTIVDSGVPPAPDVTPPSAKVKALPAPARKVAAGGAIRIRVTPSEAVDADVNLFIGKTKIATNSAAFADPIARVISLVAAPSAKKLARPGAVVTARVKLTDVTGKPASKRITFKLGAGKKK